MSRQSTNSDIVNTIVAILPATRVSLVHYNVSDCLQSTANLFICSISCHEPHLIMIVGPCSERQIILSSIGKALNVPVDTIDTTKSFTEHGGHSLSAVEIQNECRGLVRRPPTVLSLLISPSIDEVLGPSDRLDITQDATKADTPDTSDSGFVEPPLSEEASNPSTPPSIHASTVVYDSAGDGDVRTTPPPMTLGDSGFWQSPPLDAGRTFGLTEAPATEMQTALILGGQSTIRYFETWRLEDVVVLKHAWTTVIRMEPIFRTCFQESASGSYVMRLQDSMIPWEEVITFDRQSYEAALAKQEPLSGPKFQFKTVIYSSPDRSQSEGTILFSVHHALLDGFSMSRLTHKVRCVAVGHTDINPGKSFLDAAQELYCIRKDSERQAVSFWARKATQFPTATTGFGLPRPKRRGVQEEPNEVNILFGDLADRLQDTSRALGVTVASFFHAAWALVQALYTDSDSIVVGTILSGRNLQIDHVDTVIGPLLNSLPLHVSVERKESTGSFVRRIFQDLAVLSCLQWSTSEHGFSRNFEAAISVTRGLQGPAEDPIRPIRESGYDFESNVPLSVAIDEVASSIRVVYHSNLYSRASVEGLASCFRNALESLTYPTSVQQCMDSLVTVPMQGQLRVLGNCLSGSTTRTAHREDLVFLFETAVRYHPKSTAVEIGQRSVTYSELDKLASRVSETLERLGVSGEVVCAHADGSLNWVVSLIGILKAGAIICSLDATLPADLRASMFNAAGSRVFIVGNETETCFKPPDCSHCLVVDTIVPTAPDATQQPTARILTPAAPAYLCFTSGSTGTPKGVLCTHQGLAAFQKDLEVRLHAAPGVRISQFMSPAFDGSIHEIFSALCYGSTLVLRSSANPFDVLRLVDSAIMTPSVASTISPLHFQNLRTVRLCPRHFLPLLLLTVASGLPCRRTGPDVGC